MLGSATQTGVGQALFGAVAGGVTAALQHGNVFEGAAMGLTIALLNHVAHRMDFPDNGYDKNGKQINNNGGDTTDYMYDDKGNIISSTSVNYQKSTQWNFSHNEFRGYGWRANPNDIMATGAITEDNTIFELAVGSKVNTALYSQGEKFVASRFFRKFVFSSATTNKGGAVKTFFGTIKYVGERSSTFGTKLGYTKSIKLNWSGKEYHLFDW